MKQTAVYETEEEEEKTHTPPESVFPIISLT